MGQLKFTNNAYSTLASGISNSDVSISVQAGHGSRFPTLSAGDYFYATLINSSNTIEIVKVTARSSDTLTVTRAQDNTTASAFSSGDRIELRVTAASLGFLPDALLTTRGDIIRRGSSAAERLAIGASNTYLKSDGTDASWSALPTPVATLGNLADASGVLTNNGSGTFSWVRQGLVLLTSGSASGATTIDIPLTSYTGYRGIIVEGVNFYLGTTGGYFWLRTSTDGGSSYDTTGYDYALTVNISGGGLLTDTGVGNGQIPLSNITGGTGADGASFTIKLLGQTGSKPKFFITGTSRDASSRPASYTCGGFRNAAADVDAIRIGASAGTISGGYAVYGLL